MTTLEELSENAILQNLEYRYKNQKIYVSFFSYNEIYIINTNIYNFLL